MSLVTACGVPLGGRPLCQCALGLLVVEVAKIQWRICALVEVIAWSRDWYCGVLLVID